MNLLLDLSFGSQIVLGGFALVVVPLLLTVLGVVLTQVPSRE